MNKFELTTFLQSRKELQKAIGAPAIILCTQRGLKRALLCNILICTINSPFNFVEFFKRTLG